MSSLAARPVLRPICNPVALSGLWCWGEWLTTHNSAFFASATAPRPYDLVLTRSGSFFSRSICLRHFALTSSQGVGRLPNIRARRPSSVSTVRPAVIRLTPSPHWVTAQWGLSSYHGEYCLKATDPCIARYHLPASVASMNYTRVSNFGIEGGRRGEGRSTTKGHS